MMTAKCTLLAYLFALSIGTSASGIPNIPQCNSCFNSLPKGCVEKISNSGANTTTAQTAYQDCLCTKQYMDNFVNCATCSAQSMNSDQVPTEKDKNDAVVTCASNGFPIQGSSAGTSLTPTESTQSLSNAPITSSSRKPESTIGAQSARTNIASESHSLSFAMISGILLICLGLASQM